MAVERSGSVPEEEEVGHEIRTNEPDSDDVLDFELYYDEPEDEVHPSNRAQPEATQNVPTGDVLTGGASAENPLNRSRLHKSNLIRGTIIFGIYLSEPVSS